MGSRFLRKIQLGRESTAGTAVPATTYYRGQGMIEDKREIKNAAEDVAILSGTDRTYTPRYAAELVMTPVEATFEQFLHLLEASVKTATPTQDGAGSDYISTYALPTTAAPTIKTYTIEGGDSVQEAETEYSHVQKWSLKGGGGEAWMMGATWIGRQVTASTFTGALSVPAVDTCLFGKTALSIDAVGGSYGGTAVSNALLEAELNYDSGHTPRFTDGAGSGLYFSHLGFGQPKLTGKLVFEYTSVGVARETDMRAETARKFRLNIAGPAVTSPGTTYSTKILRLDFLAKIMSAKPVGEKDGNDIIEVEFTSRYNLTAADWGTITVVHELSAIP